MVRFQLFPPKWEYSLLVRQSPAKRPNANQLRHSGVSCFFRRLRPSGSKFQVRFTSEFLQAYVGSSPIDVFGRCSRIGTGNRFRDDQTQPALALESDRIFLTMSDRVCKKCGLSKPVTSFGITGKGRHRRRVCHKCNQTPWGKKTVEQVRAKREYIKKRRQNNPAQTILTDCRHSDRKSGFGKNDLDLLFVQKTISNGCSYCGDVSIRMTLDRIDNSIGHTRTNVKSCCIRCNYLRGSMPYPAWLAIVASVRFAREHGLFGSWRSTPIRKPQ